MGKAGRILSHMRKLRISLVLWLAFLVHLSHATVLLTSVSERKITVGDRIHFVVSLIVPKNTVIEPPSPDNAFGSSLVLKEWNVQKNEREKSDSIAYQYVLTTYKVEQCTIPKLAFLLKGQDKTDTLFSDAIPLQVESVVQGDTVDIKEIRPLQNAGSVTWWYWLILVVIFVSIGAIILYKFLKKTDALKKSEPPPKPPYDEAIESLAQLEKKQLLQKGLIREWVFELSEILKRYIERRFLVHAAEFTTEEMIAWLGVSTLNKQLRNSMEWFFKTSDPVKFARIIPDQDSIDRFLKEVRNFIEATKPVLTDEKSEVPQEPKEPAEIKSEVTEKTGVMS